MPPNFRYPIGRGPLAAKIFPSVLMRGYKGERIRFPLPTEQQARTVASLLAPTDSFRQTAIINLLRFGVPERKAEELTAKDFHVKRGYYPYPFVCIDGKEGSAFVVWKAKTGARYSVEMPSEKVRAALRALKHQF